MTTTIESFVTTHITIINPSGDYYKKRCSNHMTCSSFLLPHNRSSSSRRISIVALAPSQSLGFGTNKKNSRSSSSIVIPFFSASSQHHDHHDDSSSNAHHSSEEHSEIDVEKKKNEVEVGAEESEEAWKQMLESFKEHAIKMQGMSEEAYEVYSKKAIVILKETSKQLKIHAEKARRDLSKLANEVSVEGKEYLSTMAENSPEEVKDIIETFASPPNDLKEVSKVQDFYFGIPYGVLLSLGGFLSFMLTGSTSAIRFGVILGGTLLALSISSLRSWKRGESSPLALKGQAVIAGIIFLRYLRILFQRPSFSSFLTALISGGMEAFYLNRIRLDGEQKKGRRSEDGQDS